MSLEELNIEQSENVIKFEGLSFLVFDHLETWSIKDIKNHDAVIINGKDEPFIRQIVSRIRAHDKPYVYLKPIFILNSVSVNNPLINELVDGSLFSLDQIPFIKTEVEGILIKTGQLNFTNSISFEAQVIVKMISFLYTRDKKVLEPFPYIFSGVNYTYPCLSVNFSHTDEFQIFDILDQAEKDGVLTSEFEDLVYLCTQCSNGHLSYREVCPKCSSSNSTTDDIVHHFPCGYVGPKADFKNEIDDELDCPKCNKRLRHIGVDYDKPSVIHECVNCNHKFQNFFVKAKCLTCLKDNVVEVLKSKEVRKYTLTKKGIHAAINGYVSTSKDIEDIIGTIKYDTFKTMLKYEIERLKQNDGNSNICAIHIRNSNQLYSSIGSNVQKAMLKDLVGVVRSNIRSADVISFQDSSTIIMSMYDIPEKIAKRILEEIVNILRRLMKTAFKDIEAEFVVRTIGLSKSDSHELQMNNLTKDLS